MCVCVCVFWTFSLPSCAIKLIQVEFWCMCRWFGGASISVSRVIMQTFHTGTLHERRRLRRGGVGRGPRGGGSVYQIKACVLAEVWEAAPRWGCSGNEIIHSNPPPPHEPHPPPLCAILYITLMEILLRVLSNKVQTLHAIKRSPPRHQSRSRLNWNDLFLGHKHEAASTVSPLLSVIIPPLPPPPHPFPPPPPPSSDHVSKAIKPLAAVSASTFDSCSTSHVYSQLQLQTHTHTVGEHRVYTETWDGGR